MSSLACPRFVDVPALPAAAVGAVGAMPEKQ